MTDGSYRRDRTERAGLSPVEAIMTGLLGLAVVVTLGFAMGSALGGIAP